MKKNLHNLKKEAQKLDKSDILKKYQTCFDIPKNQVYLSNHSLGLPTKKGIDELNRITKEWANLGVKGWIHSEKPWFTLSEKLSDDISFIFGAKKHEIILHSSSTVNLYIILCTFFKPDGKRRKILIEENAFPTDRYAAQAVLRLKGCNPKKDLIEVKQNLFLLNEDSIVDSIDENVALVVLPSVQYLSGQLLNIKRITQAAHKKGALICFVCAHSAGLIDHDFHKDNVDFAVFCGYKFLCAGPGSVGGLFIHTKHHAKSTVLPGWWGSKKDRQFDMLHDFLAEKGAGGFQIGTNHILSLVPLVGMIEILKKCGMKKIEEKRKKQVHFLLQSLKVLNTIDKTLTIVTPAKSFGGHVAIKHSFAAAITEELCSKGIVVDYREPNLIRIAPHPLYTTYEELYQFLKQLSKILSSASYLHRKNKRGLVA